MLVIGCIKVHCWSSLMINKSRNRNDCMELMKDVNTFASAKAHTFLYVIYILIRNIYFYTLYIYKCTIYISIHI